MNKESEKTWYLLVDKIYQMVCQNKPYDRKMRIYSKSILKKTLFTLEQQEEYEKCQTLKEFINKRFDHDYNYFNKE